LGPFVLLVPFVRKDRLSPLLALKV
jgi:hypothetical protein